MAPTASPSERSIGERVGPHPSYIEIAKPYILQSRIQKCLSDLSMSDAKEDAVRLQGVTYIDQVRRALQLPVRTFNTAVIYYHKFRLLHADSEYNFADAAAAALFTACKIEDTLKKSREILAAHWNLKVGVGEQLSSDDPRFENHSKLIIGLERLMLESAGFDFRNRYPQKVMVKMARELHFDRNNAAKTAWNLIIDLYRTLAPLKQSTPTMAIACLELAARLHEMDVTKVIDAGPVRHKKWRTSRAEVMETILDLLDLYTHQRGSTFIGPLYSLETFINIRITLNQEASASDIPRYAVYDSDSTPKASPHPSNGLKARNGIDPTSPLTPASPNTISPGTVVQPPTSAIGIRGQNGTVRFMLDAKRAREERSEVERFWKVEEEEYEVEVPLETERDRNNDREKERDRDWDRRRDSLNHKFIDRWHAATALPSPNEYSPLDQPERGRGRGRVRGPSRVDTCDDSRYEGPGRGRGRGTDIGRDDMRDDDRIQCFVRGRGRARDTGRGDTREFGAGRGRGRGTSRPDARADDRSPDFGRGRGGLGNTGRDDAREADVDRGRGRPTYPTDTHDDGQNRSPRRGRFGPRDRSIDDTRESNSGRRSKARDSIRDSTRESNVGRPSRRGSSKPDARKHKESRSLSKNREKRRRVDKTPSEAGGQKRESRGRGLGGEQAKSRREVQSRDQSQGYVKGRKRGQSRSRTPDTPRMASPTKARLG